MSREADVERQVAIDWIRVEGRFRRDLGDLDPLAASIATVGLINAVTVTPDGQLLAGERRLAACRTLGWHTIPARIVDNIADATARLTVERDENTCRKEMLVSERVALAKALEALEADRIAERLHEDRVRAGKARQGHRDPAHGSGEPRAERAREIASQAVGLTATTYYKARKVVEAATDPALPDRDREVAREALADMDQTGNVAGNYDKVRKVRDARLQPPQKTTLADLKKQRHTLTAAASALTGISYGLKQITELHPGLTSEEAAQWVGDLSEARRVIEVLIKRLKERSNA